MYGKHQILLLVVSIPALSGMALGHANHTGYSGAPGGSTCASPCHGSSGVTVAVSGFPATYMPGQAYSEAVMHSSGSSIADFNCFTRIGTGSMPERYLAMPLNAAGAEA